MRSRIISQPLVEINAGKCSWDGNFVVPLPQKGKIVLGVANDGLMRVQWITRPRLEIKDSLIVVGDAYLNKIEQAKNGRVYVLRFTSSDEKLIFWLQDHDSSNDAAKIKEFNDYVKSSPMPHQSPPSAATVTSTESLQQQSADGSAVATQLREDTTIIPPSSSSSNSHRSSEAKSQHYPLLPAAVPLASILDRNQLLKLLNDDAIAEELISHLPDGMKTREDLLAVIQSPQLQSSLGNLTRAVYSDQLPLLLTSMGATQSSGNSVLFPDMMDIFLTSLEDSFGRCTEESANGSSNQVAALRLSEDLKGGDSGGEKVEATATDDAAEAEKKDEGEDEQEMK